MGWEDTVLENIPGWFMRYGQWIVHMVEQVQGPLGHLRDFNKANDGLPLLLFGVFMTGLVFLFAAVMFRFTLHLAREAWSEDQEYARRVRAEEAKKDD